MRDHGGNLDWAMARHGGTAADWVDISTGINRLPYPVPELSAAAWRDLPTRAAMDRLRGAARLAYGTEADVLPLAGAQAAIQAMPLLRPAGEARVLGPTYNEHAAALRAAGWAVSEVDTRSALAGADLAVVVNPNNPTGTTHRPADLVELAGSCGLLVVDESFGDIAPDLSLAGHLPKLSNALVLRSFGKFYGLAGMRLGFAIGASDVIDALAQRAGPWPVSGAAIEIGCRALADRAWAQETRARLSRDAARLDQIAAAQGVTQVGGTDLFRFYAVADAQDAQNQLAQGQVWSRIFPWSPIHMRLGLPGTEQEWAQVERAFAGFGRA